MLSVCDVGARRLHPLVVSAGVPMASYRVTSRNTGRVGVSIVPTTTAARATLQIARDGSVRG